MVPFQKMHWKHTFWLKIHILKNVCWKDSVLHLWTVVLAEKFFLQLKQITNKKKTPSGLLVHNFHRNLEKMSGNNLKTTATDHVLLIFKFLHVDDWNNLAVALNLKPENTIFRVLEVFLHTDEGTFNLVLQGEFSHTNSQVLSHGWQHFDLWNVSNFYRVSLGLVIFVLEIAIRSSRQTNATELRLVSYMRFCYLGNTYLRARFFVHDVWNANAYELRATGRNSVRKWACSLSKY